MATQYYIRKWNEIDKILALRVRLLELDGVDPTEFLCEFIISIEQLGLEKLRSRRYRMQGAYLRRKLDEVGRKI